MPELPEVETVRRELEPWLSGRTVVVVRKVDAAGPKYARLERARGRRIAAVRRRGKFLLLPLSGGEELVIHLGMTGKLATERPAEHLLVVYGRAAEPCPRCHRAIAKTSLAGRGTHFCPRCQRLRS